jgi:hypothetical protein
MPTSGRYRNERSRRTAAPRRVSAPSVTGFRTRSNPPAVVTSAAEPVISTTLSVPSADASGWRVCGR